jgi:hypothetical protein
MMMYAKWFFGFNPEHLPIITFSQAGNRDALLRAAQPGEVIVFVGTRGKETAEQYRGMVIGAAEIGNKSVKTADVADLSSAPADHFEKGLYRWPEAIPMLRAWRFDPPRPAREILVDGLDPGAQVRAVPLSPQDEAAVRALNWVDVELPETEERQRQRQLDRALAARQSRPGPVVEAGSHTVQRTAPDRAWTYAMRFGKSSIWKIGRTSDLDSRLMEVNAHVPVELLDQQWVSARTHEWMTSAEAQAMEQRVLRRLTQNRTQGERVRCSEEELDRAWIDALV